MKHFIKANTKVYLVTKENDTEEYIKNILTLKPAKIKKELRFFDNNIFLDPGIDYKKNDYRHELSEKCYFGFNINTDLYSKVIVHAIDINMNVE